MPFHSADQASFGKALQINLETVERYDSMVGEDATPSAGGDSASVIDGILR